MDLVEGWLWVTEGIETICGSSWAALVVNRGAEVASSAACMGNREMVLASS